MYKCLACERVWKREEVYIDPMNTSERLCCGDLFCGGTVVKMKKDKKKENFDESN